MSLAEYKKEKLWQVLVDTVHAMIMYPTHKAYTRDTILHTTPSVTAPELSVRLNIPLGEAIVILEELAYETNSKTEANAAGPA